jgi:hypothetical protein
VPSSNPLTNVLLTALLQPQKLKPMAQAAVKEVVGLAMESAGAGMRQSATKQSTEEKEED